MSRPAIYASPERIMQKYYKPVQPISGGIHSQPIFNSNDPKIIDIDRASEYDRHAYFDLRQSLDAVDMIPTGSVRALDFPGFTIGQATMCRG